MKKSTDMDSQKAGYTATHSKIFLCADAHNPQRASSAPYPLRPAVPSPGPAGQPASRSGFSDRTYKHPLPDWTIQTDSSHWLGVRILPAASFWRSAAGPSGWRYKKRFPVGHHPGGGEIFLLRPRDGPHYIARGTDRIYRRRPEAETTGAGARTGRETGKDRWLSFAGPAPPAPARECDCAIPERGYRPVQAPSNAVVF